MSFDTLALKVKYDSSTLFASAQYRFYGGSFIYGRRAGYKGYPGEVNFPDVGLYRLQVHGERQHHGRHQPDAVRPTAISS